jgi:hypothetical protein
MSQRTATALRDYQDAESKAYQARFNSKVGVDEYKSLVRTAQLRKSIFEGLNRLEPLTADDNKRKLPKRQETGEQLRARRQGEALIEARRRQQRAHREAMADRTGNPIYLNPRWETSSR